MSKNTNHKHENRTELQRLAVEDFSSVRTTQIGGILRAIKNAVERVKISLILPRLVEDRETLKRKLSGTQFEPALRIVANYSRRRNIILKERRSPLMDHGMITIIDYFQLNNEMYNLFPAHMSTLTDYEQQVLFAFEMLLELAERHLVTDALTKIKIERNMLKNYKAVKEMREQIDLLKAKIADDQKEVQREGEERKTVVGRLAAELSEDERKINARLQWKIDTRSAAILAREKLSAERQIALNVELKNVKIEMKKQSVDIKKLLKISREENNKLLIQLIGVIRKYDSTLHEKRVEEMLLQEQLKEEQTNLAALMVFYHKEETIYIEVVRNREEEEERQKQHRIKSFMLNRAARKIQLYWLRWKLWLKKENRKKQGKKKLKAKAKKR